MRIFVERVLSVRNTISNMCCCMSSRQAFWDYSSIIRVSSKRLLVRNFYHVLQLYFCTLVFTFFMIFRFIIMSTGIQKVVFYRRAQMSGRHILLYFVSVPYRIWRSCGNLLARRGEKYPVHCYVYPLKSCIY
jgi:hypothetical protein